MNYFIIKCSKVVNTKHATIILCLFTDAEISMPDDAPAALQHYDV